MHCRIKINLQRDKIAFIDYFSYLLTMDFDYRFPLFESILYGSLNPFLRANNFTADFDEQYLGMGFDSTPDEGKYGFTFYKPANFKCQFYYHKLVQETFLYCNDILEYLAEVQDADSRAYLRLTILDRHLKTCLIKIAEILQTNNLSITNFLQPTQNTDPDLFSNSYIFHLLKVCVAKAYLEIQFALSDVVLNPLTEAMLYTAVIREMPPVKRYLKQVDKDKSDQKAKVKNEKQTPQPISEAPIESNSTMNLSNVDTKLHSVKDLIALKIGSDRTIRRLLEKKELIGIKQNNGWRIEDAELQRYLKDLKSKTNDKSKL